MISCVIATFGSHTWRTLAAKRALPSTTSEGFSEVLDVHLVDGTLAEARNLGAEKATSEWLLFLDADDELTPGFGQAMRDALDRDEARPALFTPAVKYVSEGRRDARAMIWPRIDFKAGNWCVIGTLIQRSLFRALGGFREYGLYEDYALWAAAAEAGAVVFEVPEAIYVANQQRRGRNSAPSKAERLYWHQCIGHDIWPASFEAPTPDEDERTQLATPRLRLT